MPVFDREGPTERPGAAAETDAVGACRQSSCGELQRAAGRSGLISSGPASE
jgi:hypothetical protein